MDGDNSNWTASRCLRLLRPLESRVEPLKKWTELNNLQGQIHLTKRKVTELDQNDDRAKSMRQSKINSGADPVWLPNKRQKRRDQVYSSRSCVPKQPTAPAAISLPTPFKVRPTVESAADAADQTLSKESSLVGTKTCSRSNSTLAADLSRTRLEAVTNKVDQSRGAELHVGLANGLSNLLERTRPSSAQHGCPSLLSMCLRRIPDAIRLEQQEQLSTSKDVETDVAAEVYAELEDIGSTGAGWRHLREVVRAHGLSTVRDLLLAGAINSSVGATMIRKVFTRASCLEVEALLVAHIGGCRSAPPKTIHDSLCSGLMWNASYPGSWPKAVKQLFVKGRLTAAWLGTTDIDDYTRTSVRQLVDPNRRTDILAFLESATLLVCNIGLTKAQARTGSSERAYDLIQQLIPVLTAMILIGLEHTEDRRTVTSLEIWTTLQTLAVEVLKDDSDSKLFDDRACDTRAVILMANLVLDSLDHPNDYFIKPDSQQLVRAMAQLCISSGAAGAMADFLIGLAIACGNRQPQAVLASLQNVAGEVIKHAEHSTGSAKEFLQQVVLLASRDFAASDQSLEARKFAWNVEAATEDADPLALDTLCSAIKPVKRTDLEIYDWVVSPSAQRAHYITAKRDTQTTESSVHELVNADINTAQSFDDQETETDTDPDASFDDSGYVSAQASSDQTPLRSKTLVPGSSYLESPDVLGPPMFQRSFVPTVPKPPRRSDHVSTEMDRESTVDKAKLDLTAQSQTLVPTWQTSKGDISKPQRRISGGPKQRSRKSMAKRRSQAADHSDDELA